MSSSTRKRKNTRLRARARGAIQSPIASIVRQFLPQSDNQHITKVRLQRVGRINSTVAGTIASVFVNDPSVSSEYASYQALYDEFRVVGVRFHLISLQQFSVSAGNAVAAIAYDNDDVVTPTSQNYVLEYDTAKIFSAVGTHNALKPWVMAWARPTSGGNTAITWVDAASPASSLGSTKMYVTNLTVSTAYFDYVQEFFVEFRGRR